MKYLKVLALAAFLLACSLPAVSQDRGAWRASSSNARAITGDIDIAESKITIAFFLFPIAQIRALTPAELHAAFDAEPGGAGNLYRISVAATQHLQRKNTLCGTEDTDWMATYAIGRTLHIAFFSGANTPVFTFEGLNNSPDLCGSFTYAR